MRQTSREEEMPISPGPNSSVPEIFSVKKIFFLNSSYSGSRRSEIPQIESEYCRRDEVSRRLFHHNNDLCDCDCASDGCGGCIRRNKQCFFKFFVLGLSIALILLLFGSLSYNLTRNKVVEESFEFEQTKWVSHHHEYSNTEMEHIGENVIPSAEREPVLHLPVPLYQHTDDYDSDEDLQRLQYHLNVHPDRIEPISVPPTTEQNTNPQGGVVIIYDGRDPPRIKRSIPSQSKTKESDSRGKYKFKRDTESELLFEKLNGVEEEMEKFWKTYFKLGRTVFEPFSLTTPSHSTPMQSDEYSEEEEIEDELKNMFLSQGAYVFKPVMSQKVEMEVHTTEASTLGETSVKTSVSGESTSTTQIDPTDIVTPETLNEKEDFRMETDTLSETSATESSTQEVMETVNEDSRMESVNGRDFRTWPLFHLSLPLSGLFGPSPQDRITVESPPLDTVRGISLADAKKIKKEKRKHLLLNSRVVGGSSDVRLPTGPDVSKPFVNAFETLKTNQQLSFTPSAASQFILPYQMCLFGGPFPGLRPSAHGPQPRTFTFGAPPLLPSIFDKVPQPVKSPQVPTQQNFLSFSINNYPNAPPRQLIQPSGGSFFNFPSQQPFSQFPSPNKQPIFCTYLQPPLFQFPTVPGTADFSHAKCVDCPGESQKDATFVKDVAFPSGRETICSGDKVSCLDGSSCVPVEFWCDNQVHCKDASDEAFCSCRERVSKDRICDGYIDCPHGEDETACFDCPKSAFSCGSFVSPDSCIPLSKRCDGVRNCATGADESDCSALFFQVRQNDSYHVSQATGYLHRNWKGDWFPVCVELSDNIWAKEACSGELGVIPSNIEVRFAPVPSHYKGPFIVREEDGTISLQDHCKGHVSTFITCPPMNCGTRIQHYNSGNFFRDEGGKDAVKRSVIPESNKKEQNQEVGSSRLRREETGRVVGGRESEPKAWPWAIAVYKNGAFHCGGVILDEKWVLTAAHCMEQYWKHYYEVRGGMLRRFSYSAMEQARTVSHVIIHENYDLTIMSHDLALLRLKEPFHFNRWVRPACLPVLQDGISKFASGPAPGTRCTAVGWGALKERGIDPDQLREVEIPIMPICKHKEDLVGEEICAGKLEGGKDTCQGDSGGPLLCRDSGSPASWYVAGIVSHGEGCARPGEPGAYTRISLFVDWITANTNDFQLPSVKPVQNCPGFRCRSASKLCIPRKWVCNGFTDCLEAEDEKNCNDSASESIFNRKYTNQDKFFGEGEVEGEKFAEIIKNLPKQPPVEMESRQGLQRTETTEGLEFLRGTTQLKKTSESYTRSGKEHGLYLEKVERSTTEGLENLLELLKETTTSKTFTDKATGRGFRLETSKRYPFEGLESMESIRTTEAPKASEIFTVKSKGHIPHPDITTEGLQFAELIRATVANQKASENFARTSEQYSLLESEERPTTEGLPEITIASNANTNSVSFEKQYTQKNVENKTKNSWKSEGQTLSGYEVTGEETVERAEQESRSYESVTDATEDGILEEMKENGSKEADERLEITERATKIDERGKSSEEEGWETKEVTTQVVEMEQRQSNSYRIEDEKKGEESSGNKEDENTESVSFLKEFTERIEKELTKDGEEEINQEESWKNEKVGKAFSGEEMITTEIVAETKKEEYEEVITEKVFRRTEERELYERGTGTEDETTQGSEGKESIKNFDDEGEKAIWMNYKKTTEAIEMRTEEQKSKSFSDYNDETIDEKTEGDENEIEDSQGMADTVNEDGTAGIEQEGKIFIGVDVTTEEIFAETENNEERKEEIITEAIMEENDFKIGVENAEGKNESNKDSEESKISEKEYIMKNSNENSKEDSFNTKAEEKEERGPQDYSLTLSTKTSTLVSEDIASRGEAFTTPETTKVTEIHSVRTRETSEKEINFEEYSTSGFDPLSTDDLLNSNPDYFQCRRIVQSILPKYRCDGQEDCEDGTDEENCTCVQVLQNLSPEHLCDGRAHCPDLSDEKNCSKCRPNEFFCEKSNECISSVERCDGMTDCIFGEDEAKCLTLGESLDRFQTEGLIMINKNGVRRAVCQEEETPFGAGDAIRICTTLGTIGYERYENRSLSSNCTGFHVTCAKNLIRTIEKYRIRNGNYLWPWNGVIYSDGRIVCYGVLVRPRWVLTSSSCLRDVSLRKNYLSVKFQDSLKNKPVRIDGAHEIPESNALLLHLSKEVNETETLRSLGLPYSFDSDPEKDVCIAVGDRTVFLKLLKYCRGNSRCYKRATPVPSVCRSNPWVGAIVCQSRFGWYPSSVFSEKLGYCGFEHANFTSLPENFQNILDKKVNVFPEPVCNGFRCPQGACIPHTKICDGIPDCSNKEDESYDVCSYRRHKKECKISELKCRNGRCIPKNLFGDGVQDCEDGSDEPSNVTCAEYLRLTAPERVCDGKRNCYDKTDEDYKICSCDYLKFQCKLSGYCVPKDFVCDGEKDCPGGEDEQQCIGRKIIKNNTKTHLEVVQKSYGIWHSMCPTHMSKTRSDAFCRDLGFKEALFTYRINRTVVLPQTDPFSWVKLNQKTSIGLRGNKPFVSLISFRKTCDSVKCA